MRGATAGAQGGRQPPIAFTQFIVKLYSRCNFSCPDCYVYELRDQGWIDQPLVMAPAVMDRTARRIADHVRRHRPPEVQVMLHGGEPLLAGPERIDRLAEALHSAWEGLDTKLDLAVQTNGALIDPRFLDVFERRGIQVGVSLDGTAETHDRRRPYRSGKGTYTDVARGLALLQGERYRKLYRGLLCVVDLEADPVATYEALLEFDPPAVDLLLPHATWEFPPPGAGPGRAPYGTWLSAVFDRWFDAPVREVPVRIFDALVDAQLGGASASEAWGPLGSDSVVVQSDGTIEQNDILRSTYDKAVHTGGHVYTHDLDQVAGHPGFAAERVGIDGLCEQCRGCPVVQVCGGGLRAHRYEPRNGFDNPSCYCADLRTLIDHVEQRVAKSIRTLADTYRNEVTGRPFLPIMRMSAERKSRR
ncbi:FxsB family cyclophane-forming radical SAM/SPASM peptide maturase [Streptomyces sp. NBC_00690]|uniref:FxsB family cyclophane-forming radical SAM/SPASM peptide maturase n=1 Tax=Streptomyces sp. NBC_00690 TaxID=2975808 RepID=UPI002E27FB07|nr:FxsB family cyclophane-forming radical SAM/SPASM peptide maturase [Streptomyces sp. NBC_00690]